MSAHYPVPVAIPLLWTLDTLLRYTRCTNGSLAPTALPAASDRAQARPVIVPLLRPRPLVWMPLYCGARDFVSWVQRGGRYPSPCLEW